METMDLEKYSEDGALKALDSIVDAKYMEYLNNRVAKILEEPKEEWEIEVANLVHSLDLQKIVKKVILMFCKSEIVTAQQIVGLFWNKLKATSQHRKNMSIAVVLTALFDSVYFTATWFEDQWIVKTDVELTEAKEICRTMGFPLPHLKAPKISKHSLGYSWNESCVCGGPYNPTCYELCLEHLNRISSVKIHWDSRIYETVPMKFDEEPKWKLDHWESAQEVEERRKGFSILKESMERRIPLLEGNDYYLSHMYDKRGRCYAKAYEVNYMGAKGSKASTQFAKKEIIND